MIEAVSHPSVLGTWDPFGCKPYLELYGETRPLLYLNNAQMVLPGSIDHMPQMATAIPIYEYFWTIGIPENLTCKPSKHASNRGIFCSKRNDIGADVWLFFPVTCGWRACEVVATVKYLRPLPHKHKLMEKVSRYWASTTPVVEDVANIAKLLPNPATDAAATILNWLAKLRITSLPPVEGFEWSVNKVTTRVKSDVGPEVMEGVHWTLPESMFTELGCRLTGSVAAYFQPTRIQQNEGNSGNQHEEGQKKPILARAVVHIVSDKFVPTEDGENKYDADKDFMKLDITPCLPISEAYPARSTR